MKSGAAALEEAGTGKPVWDSTAADVENGLPNPTDATEDADDVGRAARRF